MDPFFQKHRFHIGAFISLIIIAAVSGSIAYRPNLPPPAPSLENTVDSAPSPLEIPASSPPVVNNPSSPSIRKNDSPLPPPNPINPEPLPPSPATISVTLAIPHSTSTMNIKEGANVYDLMLQAAQAGQFTLKEKNFGGSLGYLIETINGVASSPTKKMFWIYYINGKKATLGISQYRLQPFDFIMWKYEPEE